KNTIIIMTSNASDKSRKALGFSSEKNSYDERDSLLNFFKIEFLNRIDAVIRFNKLNEGTLKEIAHSEIQKVIDHYKRSKMNVIISDDIYDHLKKKVNADYGARDLVRYIDYNISSEIIGFIENCADEPSNIYVQIENDEIVIKMS
ncbi:MAG: ATP-dependent Clp protease ATP-binding subunit, partial [Clostridia bacterium]|nr:ATP-dependent Clp protease ATP-binding subunit [Clostridia bacterium]